MEVNVDKGTIYDGDADDNFSLLTFCDYPNCTNLKQAVELEWAYYTKGRAERLIDYIKKALTRTDIVEVWHVWLGTLDEIEERPIINAKTVAIDTLTATHIKEIDSAEIWEKAREPRPTFWCIRVRK